MSISRTNMRAILNELINDSLSGTTSSDGNTTKTSAIDSSLARYPDRHFEDWELYVSEEARLIKSFDGPAGRITVYEAFTNQVSSSTSYELHKYWVSHKNDALNHALRRAYPFFYKRLHDSLYGQLSYNEPNEEFNKYRYTVPSTFDEFPDEIWIREAYRGDHTGSDAASTLTDSTKDWIDNELVGETIYNKTDSSEGTVTANDATTVTATLSDGTDNAWDEDDEYVVARPDRMPQRFYDFRIIDKANIGSFEFYASISEGYVVYLSGKDQLTQFSADSDTTELTTPQAEVVCLLAASILFNMQTAVVSSDNVDRFRELANDFEQRFYRNAGIHGMPRLYRPGVDWGWAR